jgi:hypothetical protein
MKANLVFLVSKMSKLANIRFTMKANLVFIVNNILLMIILLLKFKHLIIKL